MTCSPSSARLPAQLLFNEKAEIQEAQWRDLLSTSSLA